MAAWRNGIASDYDSSLVSGDCRFDPCGGHLFLLYMVPVYSLPILRQVRGPLTAYSYFLKYQVWQYIGIQSRGCLVPTKDKYLLLGRNMIPENVTLKQQTIFKISRLCTILSLTHSGPSQRDRHHPRLQRSTISYHELVYVFQFYSLSPLGSYIISARNT